MGAPEDIEDDDDAVLGGDDASSVRGGGSVEADERMGEDDESSQEEEPWTELPEWNLPQDVIPPERVHLPPLGDPVSHIKDDFAAYVAYAKQNYVTLPPECRAGIELMDLLNEYGAPLTLYDQLMKWHMAYDGLNKTVTREELSRKLRRRYNMEATAPYEVKCTLPCSGVTLKVPCHDAGAMLSDLLTDPRITDSDYLFHNDDPLAPPPDEWLVLEDVNSGLAYRETQSAYSGQSGDRFGEEQSLDACHSLHGWHVHRHNAGNDNGNYEVHSGCIQPVGPRPATHLAEFGTRAKIRH